MEENLSPHYAESSPSLVVTESRVRAGSVPNLGDFKVMASMESSASAYPHTKYSMESPTDDAFKSQKYLRLVDKLQEGKQLLSIAKSHGMRVTDENEQLKFDHSKLLIEYKNLLFHHKEEEKKCKFRDELINDLQREKEDLTVELEQLQIKFKSQEEAQEDDVIALTLQAQSLQDLRTNVELMHSENWKLNKELQLLTAKGKKDAEIIAEHKSKLHETERAYKHTLAKLRNLEERHEDFSVVAQKLKEARAQLEDALLEKDQYFREMEMLRSKIEIQTLEGLSLYKESHKEDPDVIPIARLNSTPSPPLMSFDGQCLDNSEPSSILTLLQQNSDCCSLDSERRATIGDIKQSQRRRTNGSISPLKRASFSSQHRTTTGCGQPTTSALSEYLYMTASALKIKFRDVHIGQDILAKAGQSVPFWRAYDVMQEYIKNEETKQVVDLVSRYQEEKKKQEAGEGQHWESDEDDYKIQNNVPIYHWSVLTNPRSFFNRLSTEVADKLVPTTLFPTMNRLTTWGK